jgi:SAM-dependent methyltransferase
MPTFTGEFMVPGATERRIVDDHVERYRWAASRVAGLQVLDIACGAGYGTKMLAAAGASRVVGGDINAKALAMAQANCTEPAVEFMQADICSWAGDRRSFDVIVSFETIEHIEDYRAALVNLRRLLSPRGVLLMSSPNRPITSPDARSLSDRPTNPHHVREFTPDELASELVAARFRVDRDIYGQRIQANLRSRLAAGVYRRLAKPHQWRSPVVSLVRTGTPRYFVLVARPAN